MDVLHIFAFFPNTSLKAAFWSCPIFSSIPFIHPGSVRLEGVEVFVVKDNSWTFQELTGPVDTIETLPETAWNLIVCMFGLFPGSFQGG